MLPGPDQEVAVPLLAVARLLPVPEVPLESLQDQLIFSIELGVSEVVHVPLHIGPSTGPLDVEGDWGRRDERGD
jgi:hypothetical protein